MDGSEASTPSSLEVSITALLEAQSQCVLATCGQGLPHTSLMAFAATSDLEVLVMATARTTRKYANIKANPAVSLLVDNRTERPGGDVVAKALTVEGLAKDSGADRPDLRDLFLVRHARLAAFVLDPGTALIAVRVRRYILVSGFSQVDVFTLS